MRSKNDHLGNNIINKCKEVIPLQVGGGEGAELGTGSGHVVAGMWRGFQQLADFQFFTL